MATDASELVIPAFHDVLGDVIAHGHGHGHTHYWLHGGRGSTKSSFVSVAIVLLLLAHRGANAVIIRQFSNNLRDSVYEQVLWAIAELGLERWFRARVSPIELTYMPTGQRIVFRGADDPLKLKGTKFGHGYAAVVWFEELDQFDGIEAVRSILNSLRRGGDDFWIFYTYNPPRTLWSWVNREEIEREKRTDTLVRRSSYLDVIDAHPEWLGQPFVEEAEYLREADERAWRSEYLSEVTGTGGSVFGNVTGRRLTDAQCRGFSRTRNGIDWGWFPDPWRFVRCGWVPGERRLLLFQELSANRKTPQETGALVAQALTFSDEVGKDPYQHDELIWCDDTPDGKQSMAVYRRELGLRIRPARKSNMRRLSYEWLAGLREIVIDPVRCPLAYEEFRLKEFEQDRDGTWIDEIPDGNDHSIDAVRYAMMDDVLRGA
jgi:phage terminase large subunit